MAVRGLPADAELAPDLGKRQLFNPRQQEHLARARWQRGDDRVEVAQLFGVEQSLLGQWCRIGDGLQLRVIQYLFATALALPVVIRDQVVGDAVQIGAAVLSRPLAATLTTRSQVSWTTSSASLRCGSLRRTWACSGR